MQELSKIYFPILGVLLVFSGFWYVKSFFGFLGLNSIIPSLSIEYISQFSFSVFYELINFDPVSRTLKFLALIIFLVGLAYVVPNFSFKPKIDLSAWGVESIPLVPYWLRLILAAGLTFWWIYSEAANIGQTHACRVLQGRTLMAMQVTGQSFDVPRDGFVGLEGRRAEWAAMTSKKPDEIAFLEIWRDSNVIYLSTTIKNCADERFLIKAKPSLYPQTTARLRYGVASQEETN